MRVGLPSIAGLLALAAPAAADPDKLAFFEKKVRPVLVENCYACHSADTKPAGGLRVDDLKGLLDGGNAGPAVVPGDPGKSLLLRRVTHANAERRMPPDKKLSDFEVADLTTWIKDGAAWPKPKVPGSVGRANPEYEQLRKEHWAWQPLKPAEPRAAGTIDRLVEDKLTEKGLKPVADADAVTLVRRVYFDLTGLPPTPDEIDSFVRNSALRTPHSALETLVDRLLASPAFGERWGRHWLDVARYGESTGPSRNIPYPHAWRYRDYVIDAVNADVPFNRFIEEQVAGDLLPARDDAEANRLRIATGFLALGTKDVNQRFKVRFTMDNVDEQIDVVTRSVLGLTVSCARCHDHKFDPVPQTDYYALAGIFTSTENAAGVRNQMGGAGLAYYVPDALVRLKGDLPPPDPKEAERLTAEVAEAKKAWDNIRGTPEGLKPGPNGQPTQRPYRLKYEGLQAQLRSLTDPAAKGLAAHGVRDTKAVADTELRVRGEAEKLGPAVPRGFVTAVTVPGAKPPTATQSGRLELARWLTSDANPLTARVIVNRVWAHLFDRGLVGTVDNFGVTGDTPSHPELLDHLAATFVADGWSVKRLVRRLVLTRTYQLGSQATAEHLSADPANKLLWRHAPRRLSAEEIRDAVLAAAGTLDPARPDGSVVQKLPMREIRDNGPEAKAIHEAANASRHRSTYLPLVRGLTPKALEVFDPVEQTLVSGSRDATTVPGQALFLLNSTFVRKQALALAGRLANDSSAGNADRIRTAYRRALGREPTAVELDRANTFLLDFAAEYRPEPATQVAATTARPAAKADDPNANPDQADQSGVAVTEDAVRAPDARTAAWAAFAQALFGSAEFRFVR